MICAERRSGGLATNGCARPGEGIAIECIALMSTTKRRQGQARKSGATEKQSRTRDATEKRRTALTCEGKALNICDGNCAGRRSGWERTGDAEQGDATERRGSAATCDEMTCRGIAREPQREAWGSKGAARQRPATAKQNILRPITVSRRIYPRCSYLMK